MQAPDILILWLNVHGGAFHKLLRLHRDLLAAGHSCELLFSTGPPRGLKIGADVPEALLTELAASGIRLLSRAEALHMARQSKPRVLVTDAHHDPDLSSVIASARAQGTHTVQMATLLGDFTSHGAEHLLLQHPLTLFFELEYNRTREATRIFEAQSLAFTGNLFFEPTLNPLHGGHGSRQAFFAKYGFDPDKPFCLWLPSAPDVASPDYGTVLAAARQAGMNIAAKLHPWEYAFKKHGADPWGLGRTSDEIWDVTAVDEFDTTWAYHFCDLAVLRASAMSLELPFWDKPTVILPSGDWPRLFEAQARMVRQCSVRLAHVDELASFLAHRPLPGFDKEAYVAARAAVRLDLEHDAYALTVAALESILEDRGAGMRMEQGSLRRLYDAHVTPELVRALRPTRRLRYRAGRLTRRLRYRAGGLTRRLFV